ncbi:MAG: DUF1569 domain-containing protein [Betaproteobacteria bacterium]|nr:DUF1569 domain-containing protein [Betaproteobacteria bacterium]
MSNFYIAHERNQLFRRMERITVDMMSDNGVVSGHHTVLHLSRELDALLAADDDSPRGSLWSRNVMRWWVLNLAPWPEKVPRDPNELSGFAPAAEAERFGRDFDALTECIRRFDARVSAGSMGPHPRYGALSRDDWGKYLYLHIDWHLSKLGL